MPTPTEHILADLQARGLLPPAQAAALASYEHQRPFSLHYELRALLYLGVTLLSGGLGVLVYQNIDQLGHGVIVAGIGILTVVCLGYAARHRPAFTWGQAPSPGLLPEYLLLLGCLLFLALEGYLQAQYQLFGTRYGLAAALPTVLFFGIAYGFDHRGVLSLAITALASWVGVSAAPLAAFTQYDFAAAALSIPAAGLGLGLLAVGLWSDVTRHKAHFAFTYISLGGNLALFALTASLFSAYSLPHAVALPLLLAVCASLVWYARRSQSYLFLLMGAVFGYIGVTYLLYEVLGTEIGFLVGTLYFPASAIGVVMLLINMKRLLNITPKP
ncbi:DUF2157 domain-containing protein [Hymenobacter nivis]|uniref:DUF2157 domain-containing protein n=1 Tax=Hymenobacter nivis TaxID=1850093 RepID=A0A502GKD4_9BACT|nr:DUF2157 domain-containing protein [Hymenobacter nivis]TPG62315.1 DUF2157 domain-containing protein [Hymenobacter nivis]